MSDIPLFARATAKHLLLKLHDDTFAKNKHRGAVMIDLLEELHELIKSFPPDRWHSSWERARGVLEVSPVGATRGNIKLTALLNGVRLERGSRVEVVVLHADFANGRAIHEEWVGFSPKVYTDGIQKVVEALVAFKPF